ncbi:unnamed protein product [Ixodes hexagonus]
MGAVLPSTLCAMLFCVTIGRCQGLQNRSVETEPPFIYYEDGDGDPVVVYEKRPAERRPKIRSDDYVLDITNGHFSYNRSVASRTNSDAIWSSLLGPKKVERRTAHRTLPQPTGNNAGTNSVAVARIDGHPVREISLAANDTDGLWRKPASTVSSIDAFHGTMTSILDRTSPYRKRVRPSTRTTGSWQFGYTAHSSKRIDPWGIFRLGAHRGRRRGKTQNRASELQSEDAAVQEPRHSSRQLVPTGRVKRTVLCLLVACGVFLVTLFFLVPLALWIRSQYRSCSGKSEPYYSTLSSDDPDPKPIVSSASVPAHRRNSWMSNDRAVRPRATLGHSVSEPVMFAPKKTADSADVHGTGGVAGHTRHGGSTTAGSFPVQLPADASPTSAGSSNPSASRASVSSAGPSLDATGSDSVRKRRKVLRIQAENKVPDLPPSDAVSKTTVEPLSSTPQAPAVAGTLPEDSAPGERPEAAGRERRPDSSKDWGPSESPRVTASTAGQEKDLSSISEDYQQYSDSDDVPLRTDLAAGPLPTFIRRSVTKTTRRWRNRGPSMSPSTTASSSTTFTQQDRDGPGAHRQDAGLRSDVLHRRSPATSSVSSDVKENRSFESLAVRTAASKRRPPAECFAAELSGPWHVALVNCISPKHLRKSHEVSDTCQAEKVREGPDGDVFRVVSSQGDRLLSVRRLDDFSKLPGLRSRLRVAR